MNQLDAYKSLDELRVLARAMEIDTHHPESVYEILMDYHRRKPNRSVPDRFGERVEFPWDPIDPREIENGVILIYKDLISEEIKVRQMKRQLESLIFPKDTTKRNWCFVTVGFDDKIFTDGNETQYINKFVERVKTIAGFDNVRFVVEKFRKDPQGNIYVHRHVHFIIETELRKSKVIEYLERKAMRPIQLIQDRNFIDHKPWTEVRENYINGIKTTDKQILLDMDREWRLKQKIIVM